MLRIKLMFKLMFICAYICTIIPPLIGLAIKKEKSILYLYFLFDGTLTYFED